MYDAHGRFTISRTKATNADSFGQNGSLISVIRQISQNEHR